MAPREIMLRSVRPVADTQPNWKVIEREGLLVMIMSGDRPRAPATQVTGREPGQRQTD